MGGDATLTVRERVAGARRGLGYARLVPRRAVTPYVGWIGEGNLGDEAMYRAHRALLPELELVGVPQYRFAASRALAHVPWLRCQAICLGGGTLVGNGHFRQSLEQVIAIWPDAPRFAIGVGVEDPDYREGRRHGVQEELRRWPELLRGMAALTVRGPRSQAVLAGLGHHAEVVGDPALQLALPTPPPVEPGLVGLNVGVVDDQWGSDPRTFRRAVLAAANQILATGRRLQLVSTYTPDDAFLHDLAAELGPGAAFTAAPTVDQVMAAFARCEVVVAHKLHAAILAAAVATPAIALEYRPKCRDFQESVGRGEYVMRTDALDTAVLIEWIERITAEREAQSAALARAVAGYRERLAAAAGEASALAR
jgi:polysaccharide pyruvyl transferase WcaK-like protein